MWSEPDPNRLEFHSKLERVLAVHVGKIFRSLEVPLAVIPHAALKSSGIEHIGNRDGGLETRANRV